MSDILNSVPVIGQAKAFADLAKNVTKISNP